MGCPVPSRRHPVLRRRFLTPWTRASRKSRGLRRYLDSNSYITPHFSWRSYQCSDGTPVPKHLHANAVRLHWRIELFRRRIGGVPINVDGPYRTEARNRAVGGARLSRHVQADGADFYSTQVDSWIRKSRKLHGRSDVLRIAERTFTGVGNENSGTLHVDARPGPKVTFVTWTPTR